MVRIPETVTNLKGYLNRYPKIFSEAILLHFKTKVLRLLPLLVFILILYPIMILNVASLETLVMGDIDLWPPAATMTNLFLNSWQDSTDGGQGKIYTPFVLIKATIVAAFGQLSAGKVFLLLLLPSAMISMFYASKIFLNSIYARYLCSFVFAFNPITIGEFISASPLLAFYAILPLVLYSFIRLLEADALNKKRILTFSSIAAFSVLILLDSLLILPFLLPVIAIVYFLKHPQLRIVIVKNLFIAIGIISILILPIAIGSYKPATALEENAGTQTISDPWADIHYIYAKAHFLNLSKLAGNEGTGMMQLGYNSYDQIWNWTGLILPIMAFSFLVIGGLERRTRYLSISFMLAALVIMILVWATMQEFTYPLFDALPVLFTFRNPRKLMFVLSLVMSLLFALGTTEITRRIKMISRRKYLQFGFVAIVFSLLLTYNWPIFTFDLGMKNARKYFPDMYQIPDRYFSIAETVHHDLSLGQSRTIWLPMDLLTQYSVIGLNLNSYLLPAGSVLRGSNPSYYLSLYDSLINDNTDQWGKWLAPANVKYIIVDKLAEQEGEPKLVNKWDTSYPSGDPAEYFELLQDQSDLRLVIDNSQYAIFENTEYISNIVFYELSALPYLESGDPERAYDHLIKSDPATIVKRSQTSYYVKGDFPNEYVMVISVNYDPMWKSSNEKISNHFKAFGWSNGFIVKPGDTDTTISYSYQQVYIIGASIAYLTWIIVITILLQPWTLLKKIKGQA